MSLSAEHKRNAQPPYIKAVCSDSSSDAIAQSPAIQIHDDLDNGTWQKLRGNFSADAVSNGNHLPPHVPEDYLVITVQNIEVNPSETAGFNDPVIYDDSVEIKWGIHESDPDGGMIVTMIQRSQNAMIMIRKDMIGDRALIISQDNTSPRGRHTPPIHAPIKRQL